MTSTVYTYPLTGSRVYPVNFEYLARRFVVVMLISPTARLELSLNTDYRFTGKMEITTTVAWSAGEFTQIEIRRTTSATDRLVNFTDGSILRSQDLNISQIQAIHIAEEGRDISSGALLNNMGSWDTKNLRIRNLGVPIDPQDATTKDYVDTVAREDRAYLESQMARTLRGQAGETLALLPPPASRASKILSFDSAGNPIMVAPSSGSSAELALDLADDGSVAKGAALIGRGVVAVETIEDLSKNPKRTDLRFLVKCYSETVTGGMGQFYWVNADMTAAVLRDPLKGLIVPHESDPTGATGAFVRNFKGDMEADWFGVEYGSTVDQKARLQSASSLIAAGRGLHVAGDIRLDSTWDLSDAPAVWKVVVDGTIFAGPGVFTTVRLGGIYCQFTAQRIEKLGGVRQGTALECLSMFMANVSILSIDKFGEGVTMIGIHSRPDGVNGIAWCHFDIRNINVANIAVLITTREDTPGKTNGYVNENTFDIGYMGGRKGIWFKRGPNQTGGPFGGNKLNKPGFEQITDPNDAALDMEYCSRNSVEDWRFEGPGIKGLQIREDSSCSRNCYRGSHSLTDTKIQFGGLLAKIDAQIITEGGGLRAMSAMQSGSDSSITYLTGNAWKTDAFGDSIENKVREPSGGYPSRMQVKSPTGVQGFVEVKMRDGHQVVPVGTPVVDILDGIEIISISLATAGAKLVVNMPLSLELRGRAIMLNVSSFAVTSSVEIRKSSGATGSAGAGAGITSAGLYSLAYLGDVWRISKIGEAYSQ